MTLQDDGTKAVDGQRTIGEQHAEQRRMGDNTHDECPNCGKETISAEIYDDGSGRVYCNRSECGFEDGFTPTDN